MRIETVVSGNLFALALKYLGDATQWNRLAQENNIIDPLLTGVVSLKIPVTDANAGGGIFVP